LEDFNALQTTAGEHQAYRDKARIKSFSYIGDISRGNLQSTVEDRLIQGTGEGICS